MKKIAAILTLILVSFASFNVYGEDFGNEDGDVRISLPRFVNHKTVIMQSSADPVEIVDKSENYSNDYVSVNIYKPEIHIKNNSESEKLINLKIDNIVNGFKNRVVEDSQKDNEFNKVNGLPIKQYVVNVNNTIHYNKDNILSLTLHLYSYTGGAHGATSDESLNIDTQTGNNGVLKDFLGNNSGYDETILNEIKKEVAKNPEMFFKEEVDKITKLPYNQKFFITDDGVVVYFDEYAIAPYVAGRPQFLIPFSKFPKGLNKVNITEESPLVKSMLLESNDIKIDNNQYISIPQLVCSNVESRYNGLNDEVRETVLIDIKALEEKSPIKGLTTYYTYSFKNKNSIIISMKYIINHNDKLYDEVTKNYVIDLSKNKIYMK